MKQTNDNMVSDYLSNPEHYTTGLTRIGCSVEQARAYSKLFDVTRSEYYKAADKIIDNLPNGASICDVGMGTGNDLLYFASRHPDKKFVGVELSKETIKIAQKFFMDAKLKNISCTNDPDWYLNEKFDFIVNNCVYEHVGDLDKFTDNISQALIDDGKYMFVVPSHEYSLFWLTFYYLMRYPFLGAPDTHSVKDKIMKRLFQKYDFRLVGHNTIGFRPPQTFFPYATVGMINVIRKRHNSFARIIRFFGLERALYLNVYYGNKLSAPDFDVLLKDDLNGVFQSVDHSKITLTNVLFLILIWTMWQFLIHPFSLISRRLKSLTKVGRDG